MSEPGYTYGWPVWRELMTRDAAKARAFYAALFGWTYEDLELGERGIYTRILSGGKALGGLWQVQPDNPSPSLWMSYVSVPDVDAVARLAAQLGGKVVRGPAEFTGRGRFAVVRDFAGAVFIAFHSLNGDPPVEPARLGEFCWESIATPDVPRAKDFYGKLLGWKALKGREGAEALFTVDGTLEGQIADLLDNQGFTPAWLPSVRVEKLGHMSERVAELGGEVIAHFSVFRVGRIAVVSDPAGGQLSIYEPTSR